MRLSARVKAYLALIAVSAIWGVAGVVIKATLVYIPPFTFLFWRFVMICMVTIPWYIWYIRKHHLKFKDMLPLTFLGYLGVTVYLAFVFEGFERTTALDGTLLGAITPIFIIILGVVLLKEKITKKEKLGLALVMIGSLITIIQPLLENHTFPVQNLLGNVLILAGGIIWSFFVFFSKRNFKHVSPLLITLHGSIVGLITYFPLALIENNFVFPHYQLLITNKVSFFGVFYMAFISYVLAYILYEYALSKIEISESSIFTYLHPLFAAPAAIVWLGEPLTIPFLIGAGIIASGVVLSEWK
ncbi:EamA family transporter [Candidatus Roizmanbacteria bacterium]|nr:EamA family transporter [Candidatus Roizmanbacteria bacterium]